MILSGHIHTDTSRQRDRLSLTETKIDAILLPRTRMFFFYTLFPLSLNFQPLLSLLYLFMLLSSLSNLHRWRGFFIIPTLFLPLLTWPNRFSFLFFMYSHYIIHLFFLFMSIGSRGGKRNKQEKTKTNIKQNAVQIYGWMDRKGGLNSATSLTSMLYAKHINTLVA